MAKWFKAQTTNRWHINGYEIDAHSRVALCKTVAKHDGSGLHEDPDGLRCKMCENLSHKRRARKADGR